MLTRTSLAVLMLALYFFTPLPRNPSSENPSLWGKGTLADASRSRMLPPH